MPKNKNIFDHSGGLKTALSPFVYEDKETPFALNVGYSEVLGAVSRSTQYELYANDAGDNEIQGIFPFEDVDGTTSLLMASNGIVYEDLAGTWTSRETGLSTTADYDSATFYDHLYIANGVDIPRYTQGDKTLWQSAYADEDSNVLTFTPKFAEVFRDRLYFANFGGGTRNRFRFSDLGDGTTFDSDNLIDTIENPITGMKASFNGIYVFTERTFWRWDEAYLEKIDNEGSTSNRSLAAGNGLLFFANKTGVFKTSGGRAQFISRPVKFWWDDIKGGKL